VLQVANLVNISEVSDYKSIYGIENVINQLKMRIDFGGNVTILTDDAKQELESLAHSNITRINFSLFAEVVSDILLLWGHFWLVFGR
jgi:hypothetical protein